MAITAWNRGMFINGWKYSEEGGPMLLMIPRSARPSTVTDVEVMKNVNQRIRENRRTSTNKIASEMSISHGNNRCKNGIRPNRKTFYSDRMRKIVNRWIKSLEK
jgi:hypothetical protein